MHAGQRLRFKFSEHTRLVEQIEGGYVYYVPIDCEKLAEAQEDLKIWAEAGPEGRLAYIIPAIEGILFSSKSDAVSFVQWSPQVEHPSVYILNAVTEGKDTSKKAYRVGPEERVVIAPGRQAAARLIC